MARNLPKGKVTGVAAAAALFIGGWEGLQTVAYRDASPAQIWTICYGSTDGVKKGDRKTVEECNALLESELREKYIPGVEACLRAPATDSQKVAFYSFAYNLGVGRFCKSIAPVWNSGDKAGACAKLLRFNTAGGIPLRGLTRRRQAEYELCRS